MPAESTVKRTRKNAGGEAKREAKNRAHKVNILQSEAFEAAVRYESFAHC